MEGFTAVISLGLIVVVIFLSLCIDRLWKEVNRLKGKSNKDSNVPQTLSTKTEYEIMCLDFHTRRYKQATRIWRASQEGKIHLLPVEEQAAISEIIHFYLRESFKYDDVDFSEET